MDSTSQPRKLPSNLVIKSVNVLKAPEMESAQPTVVLSVEVDLDWARVGSLEFNQKYENHKGSTVRELATLRLRLHLAGVDREKLLAQQRELEAERQANGLSVLEKAGFVCCECSWVNYSPGEFC